MRYNVKDTTKITDNYTIELLRARGVEDIEHFLNPTKEHSLQSWEDLDDMKDCVAGMIATLNLDKPCFALVVDCDVDGFTSAAILYQYIKDVKPNAEIDYYLHDGKQHGLSDTYNKILDKDKHYSLEIAELDRFFRSLSVTSHQIRPLSVTISGSYFNPPNQNLTYGLSIP